MRGEDLEADHNRTLTEIYALTEGASVSSQLTRVSWETSQVPKQLTLDNLKSNLPIMCEVKYWGLHAVS